MGQIQVHLQVSLIPEILIQVRGCGFGNKTQIILKTRLFALLLWSRRSQALLAGRQFDENIEKCHTDQRSTTAESSPLPDYR